MSDPSKSRERPPKPTVTTAVLKYKRQTCARCKDSYWELMASDRTVCRECRTNGRRGNT